VQIRELAKGWLLVGEGPSYLLFRAPEKEVTHLCTGLFRELREALKGYSAIENGELMPLVQALSLMSPAAIYDIDERTDTPRCKAASYTVLLEMQQVLCPFSQDHVFEERRRRFNSLIRAARRVQMYHGPPEAPGASFAPSPPGSFFARDFKGQILVICGTPSFVLRCKPASQIARCAQKLWRSEKDPTKPCRVPTRSELQEYLCSDKAAVKKLCRAEGCDWLPRAPAGRPRVHYLTRGSSAPSTSSSAPLSKRRVCRSS
jgi:hypothetical protein